MTTIKISNILWDIKVGEDVDTEDDRIVILEDLPKEIFMEIEGDYRELTGDIIPEIEEEIDRRLSEEYGWLYQGLEYEIV